MYRLDNWINEGCAWTIEYVDGEYINISIYSPLTLPDEFNPPSPPPKTKETKNWLILKTIIRKAFFGVILDI